MQDLTTGSLSRHLLKTMSFMLVGMIFQTLYVLIDLYWVSHLGTEAVAGVALSATRADEKAAGATVEAAKRGSSAAADGIRHVGEAVASRLHGENDDAAIGNDGRDSGTVDQPEGPSKNPVVRAVRGQVRELMHEIRQASEDIGRPT